MKNITFLDSIKCAVKGMKYAFKTEKNFKYYFFIALFLLIIPISSWTAVIYKFNRGHLSLGISCKYLKIKGWKYL